MSCGLRDVLSFEGLDTPAVLVASSVFEQAAEHQSAQLGQPTGDPAQRRPFRGGELPMHEQEAVREQVAGIIKARRRRPLSPEEARRRGFKPTHRATSEP